MADEKRGPGRPRTTPVGVKARAVFLTDGEWEGAVLKAASADDMTRNEWMRRAILRAAQPRGRKPKEA